MILSHNTPIGPGKERKRVSSNPKHHHAHNAAVNTDVSVVHGYVSLVKASANVITGAVGSTGVLRRASN